MSGQNQNFLLKRFVKRNRIYLPSNYYIHLRVRVTGCTRSAYISAAPVFARSAFGPSRCDSHINYGRTRLVWWGKATWDSYAMYYLRILWYKCLCRYILLFSFSDRCDRDATLWCCSCYLSYKWIILRMSCLSWVLCRWIYKGDDQDIFFWTDLKMDEVLNSTVYFFVRIICDYSDISEPTVIIF